MPVIVFAKKVVFLHRLLGLTVSRSTKKLWMNFNEIVRERIRFWTID